MLTGCSRSWRLKESQVVNRLYEEHRKKNMLNITDENILEEVIGNKDYKLPTTKSKVVL